MFNDINFRTRFMTAKVKISGSFQYKSIFNFLMPGGNKKLQLKAAGLFKYA